MKNTTVWKETTTQVEIYTPSGNIKTLKKVPALQHKDSDKTYIDPVDLSRMEMEYLAKENELEPREMAILLLLCAKMVPFKEGEIFYKYHMNKMLFYVWKKLEIEGLKGAFPHDDFVAEKRGPIPVHISKDLEDLEQKKLIKLNYYQWGQSTKESSLKTELTEKGKELARILWKNIDPEITTVIKKIKEELFFKSPIDMRHKVHREFPEFREKYTEEDID